MSIFIPPGLMILWSLMARDFFGGAQVDIQAGMVLINLGCARWIVQLGSSN
jgi:hypothetical protein